MFDRLFLTASDRVLLERCARALERIAYSLERASPDSGTTVRSFYKGDDTPDEAKLYSTDDFFITAYEDAVSRGPGAVQRFFEEAAEADSRGEVYPPRESPEE